MAELGQINPLGNPWPAKPVGQQNGRHQDKRPGKPRKPLDDDTVPGTGDGGQNEGGDRLTIDEYA